MPFPLCQQQQDTGDRYALDTLCGSGCACWVNNPTVSGTCPLRLAGGAIQYTACTQQYAYVCRIGACMQGAQAHSTRNGRNGAGWRGGGS